MKQSVSSQGSWANYSVKFPGLTQPKFKCRVLGHLWPSVTVCSVLVCTGRSYKPRHTLKLEDYPQSAVRDCLFTKFCPVCNLVVGRDSSVGIATRYGLDGPGMESRLGRDFPHPSRPALRPTQPPVQWVPGLSRG
jgi:hypothetical protein